MSEIINAMDREWVTYDRRPDVRAFMTRLAADPQFGFPTAAALAEGVRVIGQTDPERADLMLAELMRIATYDVIAQRIVLQALLPGLCNILGRLLASAEPLDREHVAAEVVSLMGMRIATFPIDRRPRAIACNILRDVERDYHTGRKQRELDAIRFTTELDQSRYVDVRAQEPFSVIEDRSDLEHAVRCVRSAGVVAPRDFALVVATRFDGRDTEEVAIEQHLSPGTVLRARHRAEARLAAFYAKKCAA